MNMETPEEKRERQWQIKIERQYRQERGLPFYVPERSVKIIPKTWTELGIEFPEGKETTQEAWNRRVQNLFEQGFITPEALATWDPIAGASNWDTLVWINKQKQKLNMEEIWISRRKLEMPPGGPKPYCTADCDPCENTVEPGRPGYWSAA